MRLSVLSLEGSLKSLWTCNLTCFKVKFGTFMNEATVKGENWTCKPGDFPLLLLDSLLLVGVWTSLGEAMAN